jgi:hypothetical protein
MVRHENYHMVRQCKERYRFTDTVVELTFVFIRVIFLGSPVFRSSLVLTKVTDSTDSTHCKITDVFLKKDTKEDETGCSPRLSFS